jgi:hypothetical protein
MATSLQAESPSGSPVSLKATAEGKLLVDFSGGSSVPPGSTSTVVILWTVTTAFPGAKANDMLAETTVLSSTGAIQNTFWTNLTADASLANAPSIGNISRLGQEPLTNAQLRAAALAITAAALPLPAGAATAALQTVANTALGAPADAVATTDTGTFSLISLVKRELQYFNTLIQRIPTLVGNRMPVQNSVPTAATATSLPLTTSSTGTQYVAFTSSACIALDIINNTGTVIEYRRNATGTAVQIATGSARLVTGITNANQVDVRRTDVSGVQVSLQAEAFT